METQVKFLRWPHENDKRPEFEGSRTPRLWIVEATNEPPTCTDPLEDWVRPPLSRTDVEARVATLVERVRSERVPTIGPDNVLHSGGKRLPLSESETAVMIPLIESFQSVVPRSKLAWYAWGSDTSERRNALDLRILRLRRRITALNLEITTVWGRGYLLEAAS
ncbi:winged helix-turn-helix domain-containing protein [Microlunatus soli]|uniref:Transcriptional regulatory protein, C terminal n=1 Tax=Microlunatus soli TaxID=630515 RepID=A0A1H1VTT2_9ACTN|nr:winged helix-turn-helix domain-containing protein [Microlunatus soli]SDS88317.1 Transcriptional regulatory protein, C terminal [Microlunatus soli]